MLLESYAIDFVVVVVVVEHDTGMRCWISVVRMVVPVVVEVYNVQRNDMVRLSNIIIIIKI